MPPVAVPANQRFESIGSTASAVMRPVLKFLGSFNAPITLMGIGPIDCHCAAASFAADPRSGGRPGVSVAPSHTIETTEMTAADSTPERAAFIVTSCELGADNT